VALEIPSNAGLRLGQCLISFQRYEAPAAGTVRQSPPSLGALPLARTELGFLLALAEREAFWIGIEAAPSLGERFLEMNLIGVDGTVHSVVPALQRALTIIPGLEHADGRRFDCLSRRTVRELHLRARNEAARVLVVDCITYQEQSGFPAPAPIDNAAGYRGRRLP